MNDYEFNQENNISGNGEIENHFIFYSLKYENNKWRYKEHLKSFESPALYTSGENFCTLTNVLTPDGFSMLVENHNYTHGAKSLYYIDMDDEGNVALSSAVEKFGNMFVTVYWKQRSSYMSGDKKFTAHMAIDKSGRYHIHENEGTDSKPVYYYNVYDPNSATPDEPVIHRYIGGCVPQEQ